VFFKKRAGTSVSESGEGLVRGLTPDGPIAGRGLIAGGEGTVDPFFIRVNARS